MKFTWVFYVAARTCFAGTNRGVVCVVLSCCSQPGKRTSERDCERLLNSQTECCSFVWTVSSNKRMSVCQKVIDPNILYWIDFGECVCFLFVCSCVICVCKITSVSLQTGIGFSEVDERTNKGDKYPLLINL